MIVVDVGPNIPLLTQLSRFAYESALLFRRNMWKWTESTEMEWNAEFAKRPMASFALRIRYADNNKCIGNERT